MVYPGLQLQSASVSSMESAVPVSVHLEEEGFLTSCFYNKLTSDLSPVCCSSSTFFPLRHQGSFLEARLMGPSCRVSTLLLSCPFGTTPSKKQIHRRDEQPTSICTHKPITELSKGITNRSFLMTTGLTAPLPAQSVGKSVGKKRPLYPSAFPALSLDGDAQSLEGKKKSRLRDRRCVVWSPQGSPSPASFITVLLTLLCVGWNKGLGAPVTFLSVEKRLPLVANLRVGTGC